MLKHLAAQACRSILIVRRSGIAVDAWRDALEEHKPSCCSARDDRQPEPATVCSDIEALAATFATITAAPFDESTNT
jgi:hypothetical protein